MLYYNIKQHQEQVTFTQAVRLGLGSMRGLFFPERWPQFNMSEILELDLVTMAERLLWPFVEGSLTCKQLENICHEAFNIALPLVEICPKRYFLELYHGPTLAFKDFGARFMARVLPSVSSEKITILTATSGDTGAAVAHAFTGVDGVEVVILYPQHKISPLQEKMFATLGGNIHTLAIQADFDSCQSLVKDAFQDVDLRQKMQLSSANSINVSRLLAQTVYYWFALKLYAEEGLEQLPYFCVPSGNFGNLCAGFIAAQCGLRHKGFIAATNANDTVVRYLHSGRWEPHKTVATLANAMDVSQPSNWERIEEIARSVQQPLSTMLKSACCSDQEIRETIKLLFHEHGYLADPHSACAWHVNQKLLPEQETAILLSTAHPSKFSEVVQEILKKEIPLAPELAAVAHKKLLSVPLKAQFSQVKDFLMSLNP